MPQVYKFKVSMPVASDLPRDAITNTIHMQHVAGGLLGTDLEAICDDIVDIYQTIYGSITKKVTVTAYELGPLPNPPLASKTKGSAVWTTVWPREIALCCSFAGNPSIKSQRGRIFTMPGIQVGGSFPIGERPSSAIQNWALSFYSMAGTSFPDLGGIDWKFGVYSPTTGQFTQTKVGWVDDEWDTMRSRQPRPTTRVTSTRDG